jgi:hypothetical protein
MTPSPTRPPFDLPDLHLPYPAQPNPNPEAARAHTTKVCTV